MTVSFDFFPQLVGPRFVVEKCSFAILLLLYSFLIHTIHLFIHPHFQEKPLFTYSNQHIRTMVCSESLWSVLRTMLPMIVELIA